MHQILIDLYKTRNLNSGLGRFAFSFAETLARLHVPEFEFDYLCPRNFPAGDWGHVRLTPVSLRRRYFPVFNETVDLWHSLDQFPSYFPNRRSKWVLTIHDLNFLLEKDAIKAARYLKKLQHHVDQATAITVISDFTRQLVMENLRINDKPVYRIYNGIRVPDNTNPEKPAFIQDEPFFFTIGIISPKKNFHVLVPLMKQFPEFTLVIAGDNHAPYAQEILRQAAGEGLSERIILPGEISEDTKSWLYKHCRAFFFPSLAEGFGMPVIEAMLHGKPVFTSTATSLPEIGGNMACYWPDFDPQQMAEIVRKELSAWDQDSVNRTETMVAHAKQFSWDACLGSYLAMYREVVKM